MEMSTGILYLNRSYILVKMVNTLLIEKIFYLLQLRRPDTATIPVLRFELN